MATVMSPTHFWSGPLTGAPELAAADNPDTVLAHSAAHATLPHLQAQFVQFLGHALAIAAQAQAVLVADMSHDHHASSLMVR